MKLFIMMIILSICLAGSDEINKDSLETYRQWTQMQWQRMIEEKAQGKSLSDLIATLEGSKPLEVDTNSGYIKAIKACGQLAFNDYLNQLRLYNRIWSIIIIEVDKDLSNEEKTQIFVNALLKECASPIDTSIIGGQRADHRIKHELASAIFRCSKEKALSIFKERHRTAKSELLKYLNCLLAKCGVNKHNAVLKNYLLVDEDPLIRGWAAEGLGATKDTTAIELLKKAMGDTTCYYEEAWLFTDLQEPFPKNRRYYVRNAAAGALKNLGVNVKYRKSSEGLWEPYIEEEEQK